MKVCVLFNPRSGSAGQLDAVRAALGPSAVFRELGPDDDFGRLAAELARSFDLVAVAGGDGTVSAAVNGLAAAGSRTPLAVIPLGTGNDFARTAAVPLDPAAAAGLLRAPRVRSIDVARVEGGRAGFMVNAATGGFSGKVAADTTAEVKAFWGPLAYLRGAVGLTAELPRFRLTLRLDGGPPETLDALNVVVANCRTAAGGVAVAPLANPEDGLLDVVIVRAGDALDLSVVAARLMHGDYTADEHVVHRLARRVEVESDPPIAFSVDGELSEGARFAFELVPRAVRVVVGPDYHPSPDPGPAVEDDEPEAVVIGPKDAPPPAAPKGVGARLFGLLAGLLLLFRRVPRVAALGLGLFAAAVIGFVGVAERMTGEPWREFNESVMRAQVGLHTPALTTFARGLTWFGGSGVAAVVVLALGVFLARRRYLDAATLVVVTAGLWLLETVLKPAFAVARPEVFPWLTHAGGYSFPSGHALRGVGVFGCLAAVTVAGRPGSAVRWVLGVFFGLVGIGVCWTRVYLGVHWPTDVIAGALAATAWVTACMVARQLAKTRQPREGAPRPA